MKLILTLLLSLAAITACTRSIPHPSEEIATETATSTTLPQTEGLQLTLTALNLSEDANRLSTQDDELILLAYTQDSTGQSSNLLFQEYFTLDTAKRVKEFSLSDSVLAKAEILVVLIEMDSKRSLAQVEPVVRLNLDNFLSGKVTSELLGDDDLLGTCRFSGNTKNICEIEGRRLFDSYRYTIKLEIL